MSEETILKAINDLEQRVRNLEVNASIIPKTKSSFEMPFGKHKGKPLNDVPKSYIIWIKENGVLEKPENVKLKAAFAELHML